MFRQTPAINSIMAETLQLVGPIFCLCFSIYLVITEVLN